MKNFLKALMAVLFLSTVSANQNESIKGGEVGTYSIQVVESYL